MKPLAIDLFCGLGGWAEGFLAEGYDIIGYDIEAHRYPKRVMLHDSQKTPNGNNSAVLWKDRPIARYAHPTPQEMDLHGTETQEWEEYPGKLILRDVRSIHGSECKDATVIVASPPCQAYSYRAMPWSRAKALPPPDNTLFSECFRIQREASEAAGRYIPLIVENVRGAQKWVGRAQWHYGSYYLWGDVPALMPSTTHTKLPSAINESIRQGVSPARWTNPAEHYFGRKVPGIKLSEVGFNVAAAQRYREGVKQPGISGARENGKGGKWFQDGAARHGSRSDSRKAASAMIAKIPFPLSSYIAKHFKPQGISLVESA